MKRGLIASFVFAQIYAQFVVYEPRHGIDRFDAMTVAPILGFLFWMAGLCAIGVVESLLKETEKKQ